MISYIKIGVTLREARYFLAQRGVSFRRIMACFTAMRESPLHVGSVTANGTTYHVYDSGQGKDGYSITWTPSEVIAGGVK